MHLIGEQLLLSTVRLLHVSTLPGQLSMSINKNELQKYNFTFNIKLVLIVDLN